MASITRRGKRWRALIRRKGYPTRSKSFKTNHAAVQWARYIEREIDRGAWVSSGEADRLTLGDALDRYQIEVTAGKKGATKEASRLSLWRDSALADRTLASIRSTDIVAHRDARISQGRAASTIRNEMNLLSNVFTVARAEWGLDGLSNPVAKVRRPALPPGRDRRLVGDEETRLLDAADYPMRELIIIAIDTGMRAGEIMAMQWQHVDLKRRTVYLPKTKNGQPRTIPLTRRVLSTLQAMPRQINGQVIPPMRADNLSHKFKRICSRAGIDDLRLHDLRHEATSRLFEKGLNIMEVASITGHKTLNMLKRYTHPSVDDLAEKIG